MMSSEPKITITFRIDILCALHEHAKFAEKSISPAFTTITKHKRVLGADNLQTAEVKCDSWRCEYRMVSRALATIVTTQSH